VEGQLVERYDAKASVIPAGGILFHPAYAPHAEDFPSAGARVFNIQLDGGWLGRIHELNLRAPADQRVAGPTSELTWLAWQIRSEWRTGDDSTPLAVEGLLVRMLTALLREPIRAERRRPAWVLAARDALHSTFRAPPQLGKLASELQVDPAHLTRTFQRYFGCAPSEYVRRLRVEHARRSLEGGTDRLSQVALDAGFSDQSHLTRLFRRYVGVTPGVYRNAFERGGASPRR
ncbi:MAG TPA: AraC family transcriptional regulator, partial [Gemmatimonadaceae bacterium]|nr:AraC family transcriptional regulator [Gemmatimonadaceae bacterium]